MFIKEPMEFSIDGPMICASEEAEAREYDAFVGKTGRIWLVARQENSADNIYVEGSSRSEGFAGRTLQFRLVNFPLSIASRVQDNVLSLRGPWHSNSQALFEDAAIDVRDKHLIQGIVALQHERGLYSDVIHYDEKPTIGEFDRIVEIAQYFTKKYKIPTFYAYRSVGGGSSGMCS